jgi:hypothetical protein
VCAQFCSPRTSLLNEKAARVVGGNEFDEKLP